MLLDNKVINMNNTINKFLLVGDKFMPEIHLKQSGFMYSACGPFTKHNKDLLNRTRADKILGDKAYAIASNPQYDGYQRGLASMVYNFFDKKTIGSGIDENELANEN